MLCYHDIQVYKLLKHNKISIKHNLIAKLFVVLDNPLVRINASKGHSCGYVETLYFFMLQFKVSFC